VFWEQSSNNTNSGQTALPFFSFFSQHAIDRIRVGSSQEI